MKYMYKCTQREYTIQTLLDQLKCRKFKQDATNSITNNNHVAINALNSIWQRKNESMGQSGDFMDVSLQTLIVNKKGRQGLREIVEALFNKRDNPWPAASALSISKSILFCNTYSYKI